MKKFLLGIVVLVATAISAIAQTTLTSGAAEMKVELKRAVAQGNEVVLDFMVTSYASNWGRVFFSARFSQFYDDEGNLYEGDDKIEFKADGYGLSVERDIPRKLKVIVKGVDEYATTFLLCRIKYYVDSKEGARVKESEMTIKNLSIERP